jgi:hypothetical protein
MHNPNTCTNPDCKICKAIERAVIWSLGHNPNTCRDPSCLSCKLLETLLVIRKKR